MYGAGLCRSHRPSTFGVHRQASVNSLQSRRNAGLPMNCKRMRTTARVLSTNALMPKSAIFASPVRLIKMLAGFMSRWTYKLHASVQPMSRVDCSLSSSVAQKGMPCACSDASTTAPAAPAQSPQTECPPARSSSAQAERFSKPLPPVCAIPAHALVLRMHAQGGRLQNWLEAGGRAPFRARRPESRRPCTPAPARSASGACLHSRPSIRRRR